MIHWLRDYAGFLSVASLILATLLTGYVALRPPKEASVCWWLIGLLIFCLVAGVFAFVQQAAANQDREAQGATLNNIAVAVGVAQAEAADSIAETKRQVLELTVKYEDAKAVVIIRMSIDGDRNPNAKPSVENIGKSAATNIKIEDITIRGARGPGTFEEVDALAPGETREVQFYAPDEGILFGQYFIRYLANDLEHRPRINWEQMRADNARDLFEPLRMPLYVQYTDPATGRRYRSEHELEFTFSQHVTVIFKRVVDQ